MTNKTTAQKKLNNFVKPTYFVGIPLGEICKVIKESGGIVLDIDDTELTDCILCGADSRASFKIQWLDSKKNSWLYLAWYRMPSGKYEITSYIS